MLSTDFISRGRMHSICSKCEGSKVKGVICMLSTDFICSKCEGTINIVDMVIV